MSALLPCPFEHTTAAVHPLEAHEAGLSRFGVDTNYVHCTCGANGPVHRTPDAAIAAWNKRRVAIETTAEQR